MQARNARIGLWLFSFYLILYSGFVMLNAFAPQTMEWTPLAGVNLAIWYGFVLIVAAFGLALLYGVLCRDEPPAPSTDHSTDHSASQS
ncbi:MAG: DUF485 domain-containing protein [Planctomycetales bacterium]|nr:DUF485 domain-containing protein [Planctomycetales bacterium]